LAVLGTLSNVPKRRLRHDEVAEVQRRRGLAVDELAIAPVGVGGVHLHAQQLPLSRIRHEPLRIGWNSTTPEEGA
jgi:hypothetical protein